MPTGALKSYPLAVTVSGKFESFYADKPVPEPEASGEGSSEAEPAEVTEESADAETNEVQVAVETESVEVAVSEPNDVAASESEAEVKPEPETMVVETIPETTVANLEEDVGSTDSGDVTTTEDAENAEAEETIVESEPADWVEGERVGPFSISAPGLEAANTWLAEAADRPVEISIIDEIGPLELNGGGLAVGLRAMLASPFHQKLYIVIRTGFVEAVCQRFRISEFDLVNISVESSPPPQA